MRHAFLRDMKLLAAALWPFFFFKQKRAYEVRLSLVGSGANQAPANTILYDEFTLRALAGVSIFWNTPIGPLRFNFTDAVKTAEYDVEQNFDLTISASF